MALKGLPFTDELQDYLLAHSMPRSVVHERLVEVTHEELGETARMQIAPEQGAFLTLLVRLIGAHTAVEVGTFTGLSALCIAEGLPDDGTLTCFDISEHWTSIGIPFWEEAGLADRIELVIGPAAQTLAATSLDRPIDFAFIDADKAGYSLYVDLILQRMRPGGLIVVDNALFGGEVLAAAEGAEVGENAAAIHAFNEAVAADDRVECSLVNVGDGLLLVRKR